MKLYKTNQVLQDFETFWELRKNIPINTLEFILYDIISDLCSYRKNQQVNEAIKRWFSRVEEYHSEFSKEEKERFDKLRNACVE